MSENESEQQWPGKGRDPFDRELRFRRRTWRTLRDFCEGLQHCAASSCHNPDTWTTKMPTGRPQTRLLKRLRYKTIGERKGGITVSGGEPLLQIDFPGLELFRKAKRTALSTTLDTSGNPFTRGAVFQQI